MSLWRNHKPAAETADEQFPVIAVSRKGKKYTVNLEDALIKSRLFFQTHGLDEYAQGLPAELNFEGKFREAVAGQLKWGFENVLWLPGLAMQEEVDILKLKKLMTQEPVSVKLKFNERYSGSFLDPRWVERQDFGVSCDKLREQPYLLMYSNAGAPMETKNKSFTEVEGLFSRRNWNGLTLREYFLLQRLECEKNKDHRFDALHLKKEKSQWTFLLDARLRGGCLHGSWDPNSQTVDINLAAPTDRNPKLGCRPIIIIPMT